MTKNFKTERERLEKEIKDLNKLNKLWTRDCGNAEPTPYDDEISAKEAKLTQLNEDEEMCKKEIDEIYDNTPDYVIDVQKIVNKIFEELKQNLFGGEELC